MGGHDDGRDDVAGERRRVFPIPASDDVSREIRFHIDMRVQDLMRQGWSEDVARAEAERLFGDRSEVGAECVEIVETHRRSERRAGQLDTLSQDLRFGARSLLRQPAFTVVAVLTLALGIGANAAIFSVIESVLLTPPPYPEPERLITVWEVNDRGGTMHVAAPNFRDWQERSRSFDAMAAHPSYSFGGPITVLGGSEPARVWAASVSPEFFRVMGVQPQIGRTFSEEDARPGAAPVAVVAHDFWRDRLGGSRDLAGTALLIGQYTIPVVGVMPPDFRYPERTSVWAPDPLDDGADRTSHNYAVTARLRPGVSPAEAQRELSSITRRLAEEHAGAMDAVDARVTPLGEELVGDLRQPLLLLLGAAGLVLLIACTNLASTMLARTGARRLELAVRSSLGATRTRLVRQLFTESLLLAALGTVAGLVLAFVLVRALTGLAPSSVLRESGFAIDARVLGFSAALALASACLFGLLPALRLARGVGGVLREDGRGTVGPVRRSLWNGLVAAEVALALVLLVGSGLLVRSFQRVMSIDPGFDARGVLTVDLDLPGGPFPNDTSVARFHEQLLHEIRGIAGVDDAGVVNHLPLAGTRINGALEIEGRGEDSGYADYRVASDGYFDAMGIAIVSGRAFDERDRIGTPTVAVIDQTAAQRFFPGEDAVGKRIRRLANDEWYYGDEWITIIGVAADVRHGGLLTEPAPAVYVSALQRAMRARAATLVIRTRDLSPALTTAVRDRIRSIAPDVPIEPHTMRARLGDSVGDRRFSMLVLATFAAIALVLAAVGIYGVVSYGVERRRREMGVRLALGAAPSGVRSLVVAGAMRTVIAGLVLGTAGALALTRLLRGMLFGVTPFDRPTFAATALLLGGIALLASWIPARRTTRIDPMVTLRTD